MNYLTYKEMLFSEKYLLMSVIGNFSDMAERYVKTVTRSHEVWAEASSALEEVARCVHGS